MLLLRCMEQQGPLWRSMLISAANGAARALVGLLTCTLVGAVIGGAAGWWYAGPVLAAIGAIAGAGAGLALWLVVHHALYTL